MSVRLGELLTKASLISQDQLKESLRVQKETGGKLGETLIKLGFVTEEDITECLSQQFGVPSINLQHFEIDASVIKLIPGDVARKYNILPVNKTGATITIAMADPTNVFAMDDIKFMTGYNVEPVVASELGIKAAIDNYYGTTSSLELKKVMEDLQTAESADLEVLEDEEEMDVSALADSAEEAPVVKLCNLILTDAIKRGASDIHIEPYEKEYRVRYRIDGILYEMMHPPLKLKEAITSRAKIMARLDIAEKRLPQDGRIKIKTKISGKTKDLDYRVSVLPTLFGEKIVMRLLDKDKLMLDMTKLGFEPESLRKFESAILRPYGMVLVTGPTGSGKTNSLYSALQRINTPEVNIMTAMTGHLVLSTLHTNDAPSTINRMMNMGIEPFLVATSVHLIVAQRLVRRICTFCKEPAEQPPAAMIGAGFSEHESRTLKLFKGRGCDRCSNTGYKGRVGLYEVLEVGDELKEMILSGGSAFELRQKA